MPLKVIHSLYGVPNHTKGSVPKAIKFNDLIARHNYASGSIHKKLTPQKLK